MRVQPRNRMRENCTSGSARGAPGNRRSYRGGYPERKQDVLLIQNGRECCRYRQRMPSRGKVLYGQHINAEEYGNGNIVRWCEPHRNPDGGYGEIYPLLSGGV